MNPGALIPYMPFAELYAVGVLLIGLVIWKGSRRG